MSWPWVAGWLHTEISVRHRELNPDTVAHLSANRARRRLTTLIEANALTTTPDHQLSDNAIIITVEKMATAMQCAAEIVIRYGSNNPRPFFRGRGGNNLLTVLLTLDCIELHQILERT